MLYSQTILFGLAFLLCKCNGFERSPAIEIKTGIVRGHLVKKLSEAVDDVYEFSAIPFAEPPIGIYRYQKTVPKKGWTGELDAIHLPNECLQAPPTEGKLQFMMPVNMSEDCLYLNIWTPKLAVEHKKSLPVFFWIHGGAYFEGSSTMTFYNGTVMSSFHSIVFVSIQYRIGPLGFAYLGVPEVPGNMGLWDQVEALKWTYENIAAFGGDPSRITIAGQSAGAASATLLLLSPHSQPYIHQAIIQSGSVLASWSWQSPERALKKTNKLFPLLAKRFSEACGNVSSSVGLDFKLACLRTTDANFPIAAQSFLLDVDRDVVTAGVVDSVPLPPVIDGDLLLENPIQMVAEGKFSKVPLLIGLNRDEGTSPMLSAPLLTKLLPSPSEPHRSFENFTYQTYQDFVRSYFVYYPENGQKIDEMILQQLELKYWPQVANDNNKFSQPPPSGKLVVDKVSAMIGDNMFTCPTISWAAALSQHAKVHLYLFNHSTVDKSEHDVWKGVRHSEELQYTMGDAINEYLPRVTYTEEEQALSRRMMQYWANFVKTGDPNVADLTNDERPLPVWPIYTGDAGDTLELSAENPDKIINSFKERDCLFWARYLPKLNARLNGQLPPGVTAAPCPQYKSSGSKTWNQSFCFTITIIFSVILLLIS